MPAPRQFSSGSRRALPLYTLLLSTLLLAGILGYQAYDSARSHRATARHVLSDYAQLANWRYQEWAYWAIEKSLSDVLAPLGFSYEVHRESLWEPSVLLGEKRKSTPPLSPMPILDYAFRIEKQTGALETAGRAPARAKLDWIRDTILAHAESSYDVEKDPHGIVAGKSADSVGLLVYTIRSNRSGAEYVYGFELGQEVLPDILKATPPDILLLPPSLTGEVPNEKVLSVAVGMPPEPAVVVLGESLSKDYWAAEPMHHPYSGIMIYVGLEPEVAENLVIGGLPASRLPIVLGAFLLAAGLILAAARQIRREDELARARADFAMGVSHELRTPLTQIRMFLESVLLGRTVSSDQERQYLEIAYDEAKRLSNLVDNVLRFSKVERGTARLDAREVDLSESARTIMDSWVPGSQGKSRVELRLTPQIPVTADTEALRAVLGNLVDNAVKYGPAGQTILVGTERVNGAARIWVSDEGPGIPRADRRRIWEPYRRLDRDANSAVAGTGIGLSIVREFVRLHEGDVWVEEAETGGSRFVVELPLRGGRSVEDDGDAASPRRDEAAAEH